MMGFKSWLNEVYSNDNYYLSKYLKNKDFSMHDNIYAFLKWNKSKEVLMRAGIDYNLLKTAVEYDEIEPMADKIYEILTSKEKEDFIDFVSQKYGEAPSWNSMDMRNSRLPRNTWLVHFTDQNGAVASGGFQKGVDDFDKLALTRHLSDESKKYGGYNFAFIADSKDAKYGSTGKYGNSAVMFQASGIEVYHYGDEEHQIIFWGKAIDPRTIVQLDHYDGEWSVAATSKSSMYKKGRDAAYKGEFTDVVDWVERHWFQYKNQIFGH